MTGSVISNVDPSAKIVWSVKTGGLSWQWSLKTGFTVVPNLIKSLKVCVALKLLKVSLTFRSYNIIRSKSNGAVGLSQWSGHSQAPKH